MRSVQKGKLGQEPITRSMQLPHFPVTAFSQTDLFLVKVNVNSDPRRNLSNQSQARTKFYVFSILLCRHVHVRPPFFYLTDAHSCRPELNYFAGKEA